MPRTLTPTEAAVLGGSATPPIAHARSHVRLEVEDAAGVMQDMTSVLHGFEFGTDVDRTVIQGTVRLVRSPLGTLSLSPLVTDALDAGRDLRIYFTTLTQGSSPASGDLRLVLDAVIDSVDAGGPLIELAVRDKIGATLADHEMVADFTLLPRTGGYQWEEVLQSVLETARFEVELGTGPWPPIVPFDPAATGLTALLPGSETIVEPATKLLEIVRGMAERTGWQLRPRWNETDGEFQLAFYAPDYDKATVDWYIPSGRYISIPVLQIDREHIRNAFIVSYVNESGVLSHYPNAPSTRVPYRNEASIARFGFRFMQITENGPPIETEAAAQALVEAAEAALADLPVDAEAEVHMLWPVDLEDRIQFGANDEQFLSDQTLAVVGWRHTYGPNLERTRLQLRGKPTGGVQKWVRRPIGQPRPPLPSLRVTSTEGSTTGRTFYFERGAATDSVWVYLRTVPMGSGKVVFDAFDLADTLLAETEYFVSYPPDGYETHVLLEPRDADPSIVGDGALFVVGPATIVPELITPTHTETGAVGEYGITLSDPSGVAAGLYYRTKSGPDAWGAWTLKTATPAHGATYTETVALVEAHPSYVEFRLDYEIREQALSLYSLSAGMDYGFDANVVQLDYWFAGDRLWLNVAGDSDTRQNDYTIIGDAAETITAEITLSPANFSFFLKHSRAGVIDTGIDIPQEAGTVSGIIAVRAIDQNGNPGPVRTMPYEREGTGGGTVSIDSFTAAESSHGTNCGTPATAALSYSVTMPGGHTVTIERHVDGALSDTPVAGSSSTSGTPTDTLPFYGDGFSLTPFHDVTFRLLIRDGSSNVVASQWYPGTLRYYGTVDCP